MNDLQELIQSVLNKEPASVLIAKRIGQSANAELQKLAVNEDAKVRRIALYCLNETGGPSAIKTFIDSLMDKDPQVRGTALSGINNHLPSQEYYNAIIEVYDKSDDPYVRQQVALIIGRMNVINSVQDIKRRYEKERDPLAQEGCIVALAKLGDISAQEEFIKRLNASSNRVRLRFLEEYCPYINSKWLLKPLSAILEDKSPLLYVGLEGNAPETIQDLRACDLAVNLIANISMHKFSFEINRSTNYNDAQISEVKRYVQSLP